MTGSVVVVAALAAAAVALGVRPDARRRLRAVRTGPRGGDTRPVAEHAPSDPSPRPAAVGGAALSAGVGVWLLVGGPVGAPLGAAVAAVTVVFLRRLEPTALRRRRQRLAADLPTAVDLLAACTAAGRPPTAALPAVASAVGGPLAHDLRVVTARLDLGADPVALWQAVAAETDGLGPLGRAMARSLQTGAPLADDLHRLGTDLRARRRAAAEQRARSVGVRAAAPLGLCFLPAFVLVGIVPSVLGLFASLSWW